VSGVYLSTPFPSPSSGRIVQALPSLLLAVLEDIFISSLTDLRREIFPAAQVFYDGKLFPKKLVGFFGNFGSIFRN
jgi:hypothetical protein